MSLSYNPRLYYQRSIFSIQGPDPIPAGRHRHHHSAVWASAVSRMHSGSAAGRVSVLTDHRGPRGRARSRAHVHARNWDRDNAVGPWPCAALWPSLAHRILRCRRNPDPSRTRMRMNRKMTRPKIRPRLWVRGICSRLSNSCVLILHYRRRSRPTERDAKMLCERLLDVGSQALLVPVSMCRFVFVFVSASASQSWKGLELGCASRSSAVVVVPALEFARWSAS